MKQDRLSERLSACYELIPRSGVFADIGTDHGYLAIALLLGGVVERAVCTDINAGPLSRARENVAAQGLSDRVEFILTDGAAALYDRDISSVAICGMGGELISRIIREAEFLKNPSITLVLQPMTHEEELRRCLFELGYKISAEKYSCDSDKYYVTLRAVYSAEETHSDITTLYFGYIDRALGDREALLGYLIGKEKMLTKKYRGLVASGQDAGEVKVLIDYIQKIIRG